MGHASGECKQDHLPAVADGTNAEGRYRAVYANIETAQTGDTLISLLRQLRAGHPQRPNRFPKTVILCGALAPNSPPRAAATAHGPEAADAPSARDEIATPSAVPARSARSRARYLWVMLLARLFELMPLTCPRHSRPCALNVHTPRGRAQTLRRTAYLPHHKPTDHPRGALIVPRSSSNLTTPALLDAQTRLGRLSVSTRMQLESGSRVSSESGRFRICSAPPNLMMRSPVSRHQLKSSAPDDREQLYTHAKKR